MIISPKLEYFVKGNGTSRVYIYLYDPRTKKKAKVTTDIFVKRSDWTGSEVRKGTPNAIHQNAKIKAEVSAIENVWLKDPDLTPEQLKEVHRSPRVVFTPASYFRHYIKLCEQGEIVKKKTKDKMTGGYIRALRTSCIQVERYGPINWGEITEEFLDRYVTWLRGRGFKQNSIAKYVKYFVIIYNHAQSKGIHPYPKLKYSVRLEKSQKVRLTPGEVELISNKDLSEYPELIPEQERFQAAYNFLTRFGDTIAINEKNIIKKGGRHYLSAFTQKTKSEILLPIKEKVYKILKKNGFKLKATNKSSNSNIKKIAMLAGVNSKVTITEFRNGQKTETVYKKYQLIETHTTRRSAARNLFDSGMPPEIIMVLGGWSSMKQLLDYIDIDLDYAASKAAEHPFFD